MGKSLKEELLTLHFNKYVHLLQLIEMQLPFLFPRNNTFNI